MQLGCGSTGVASADLHPRATRKGKSTPIAATPAEAYKGIFKPACRSTRWKQIPLQARRGKTLGEEAWGREASPVPGLREMLRLKT